MKKFFDNKWVDHGVKFILTLLLGWLVWLMVDVRDNNKYRQPYIDAEQNRTLQGLSDKLAEQCTLQADKNAVVHKRIDKAEDQQKITDTRLTVMDRKLDIIIYHITGKPVITDELTQN